MTDIYLTRTDPDRNMARFYTMRLQPTLFGEWTLVREWGRIGRSGQVREIPYPTASQAQADLQRLQQIKIRKGYFSH